MLRIVSGEIALVATEYKRKKYFKNDENHEKIHDALSDGYAWLEKTEKQVNDWFDSIIHSLHKSPKENHAFAVVSDKNNTISTILTIGGLK